MPRSLRKRDFGANSAHEVASSSAKNHTHRMISGLRLTLNHVATWGTTFRIAFTDRHWFTIGHIGAVGCVHTDIGHLKVTLR